MAYEVLSKAKLAERTKTYSYKSIVEIFSNCLDAISAVNSNKLTTDEDKVDTLCRAKIALTEVESIVENNSKAVDDEAKKVITDSGKLFVRSDKYGVQFAFSKPVKTVIYDEAALKEERPEVYRKVAIRNGKPMTKANRAELDSKVKELEEQLADLHRQQVEDDAAAQTVFHGDVFESMLQADATLAKYKHEEEKSSRFYFKN